MILSIFDDVKSVIGSKTSAIVQPQINSLIFVSMRLASALTAISCILVTSRNYIGDNINCISTGTDSGEEMEAVTSYCFIASTFTLTNLTLPAQSAHPGIGPVPSHEYFPPGPELDTQDTADVDGVERHSYYQWVPFLLAMQSMLLYLPCLIWESREDGYLNQLLAGTNTVHVNVDEATEIRQKSASFFRYTINHNNGKYFAWFLLCEVAGVVIAIGNLFVTNVFLGGKFFYFGEDALKYLRSSVTDANNPLNQVFPKVGKCTWHTFGPSGTIEDKDALCVLPLNIVNEKVYVALWLTYITVCAVVSAALLYHIILFSIPGLLKKRVVSKTSNSSSANATQLVLSTCSTADTFILWNMQSYVVNFALWIEAAVTSKME